MTCIGCLVHISVISARQLKWILRLVVPVSFRTLYDFDLNEASDVYDSIDVYDFIT